MPDLETVSQFNFLSFRSEARNLDCSKFSTLRFLITLQRDSEFHQPLAGTFFLIMTQSLDPASSRFHYRFRLEFIPDLIRVSEFYQPLAGTTLTHIIAKLIKNHSFTTRVKIKTHYSEITFILSSHSCY